MSPHLSHIQLLCQELESSFYDGMFPWQQLKQHDAASLLKLFIRELPHPLLTVEYLNTFLAVNSRCTVPSDCGMFCLVICFAATVWVSEVMTSISLCVCVCVYRTPHKEAAAASVESAGPFVAWGQSGYAEGRCAFSLKDATVQTGKCCHYKSHLFLQALVEFFQRVIDHQAKNKMTLNNVSVVMAPNIFMFKGFRYKITEQQEFSMATSTANIVRLLIRYQNLLWTVRVK